MYSGKIHSPMHWQDSKSKIFVSNCTRWANVNIYVQIKTSKSMVWLMIFSEILNKSTLANFSKVKI